MLETDHAVLPVANVVAKANTKDGLTKVVRVEEEPEGINNAGTLIHKNEYGRCLSVAILIRFVATAEEALGLGMEARIGDAMERMIFVDIEPGGWLASLRTTTLASNGR